MNTMVKRISIIAVAAVALAVFINAQADKPKTLISPKDAAALINSDTTLVILDVRTAEEYYSETGHLPKAILIPVQALEERIDALDQYKHR
ncbi:MAG TPA: rhodanese-like domain-containing protein, partial [Bacteroidota bacterium]|nr:rhodanese-like domain-containing protein [Bacteroidota bacterium]